MFGVVLAAAAMLAMPIVAAASPSPGVGVAHPVHAVLASRDMNQKLDTYSFVLTLRDRSDRLAPRRLARANPPSIGRGFAVANVDTLNRSTPRAPSEVGAFGGSSVAG